jgi:hypothetical protein
MELSPEEKLNCFVIPVSGAVQKYKSGRRRQRKWTLDKVATDEKFMDKKKKKIKQANHKTIKRESLLVQRKLEKQSVKATNPILIPLSKLLETASKNVKPSVPAKDKPPTKVSCKTAYPLKVPIIIKSSKINVLDSIFNASPTVIDTSMSTSRY